MRLATTVLGICVAALLSLGLVMLFSSSMTHSGGSFPVQQFLWCGLGLVAGGAAALVDYRHWRKVSWVLYLLAVGLLVAVLVWGPEVKGARRWLRWGGFSFQPSEFAKLALIVALAHYGERQHRFMPTILRGLVLPGLMVGVILVLIFREPDWGTTLLLTAVASMMMLVAGVRWSHVVPVAAAGLVGLAVLLTQSGMRMERIYSWRHPEETRDDKGYQAWQAMLALGTGGWTGVGLGNGMQKYGYVPEHQSDFIFAIIGEELGLVCTIGVLLAFVIFLVCGVYIAWHARDTFGTLLATGITFLIGLQAFINMGVVTSALPNKGLALPFISRGGSSLLVMLVFAGILMSVARRSARHAALNPFASRSPDAAETATS